MLEVHGGMGRWGGWGTFLLFSLIKSLHLGVFALLAAIVIRHWYAIPAVAALWTGIERTHGDSVSPGCAWQRRHRHGAADAAGAWVGVYGLSFLFAMMAAATALVLLKRGRKELLWLLSIPALLAAAGLPAPARRNRNRGAGAAEYARRAGLDRRARATDCSGSW